MLVCKSLRAEAMSVFLKVNEFSLVEVGTPAPEILYFAPLFLEYAKHLRRLTFTLPNHGTWYSISVRLDPKTGAYASLGAGYEEICDCWLQDELREAVKVYDDGRALLRLAQNRSRTVRLLQDVYAEIEGWCWQ